MKPLLHIAFLLSLASGLTGSATAATLKTSPCSEAAAQWIRELESTKEKILLSHTRDKCNYSADWVTKLHNSNTQNRDRSCKDLILLYAHKECVYFRDYLSHEAYSPCKGWTREMYRKCMEGDVEWFTE